MTGIDRTKDNHFYEGQYCCSRHDVERNLDSKGVDWERTVLVAGFYRDSLVEELKRTHEMRRAAIVLIDCDLYESTRQVLRFIQSLLGDGTILMMDDWNCFDAADDRGQRRAVREFLAGGHGIELGDVMTYGSWGRVLVVRTPDPATRKAPA